MSKELDLEGECMCGAVKFSAIAKSPNVVACHCNMCRRWSAGPFLALDCQAVNFESADSIGRIRSSDWAERGFCIKCGSNLFYHIVKSSDYQMAAGLFDDQSMLQMTLQVFTDSRPAFYEFANETKMMTGAEVFAMFAPPPK
jgi:hypothetical protein